MESRHHYLLMPLVWCLFTASLVAATAGPVFINPAAISQSASSVNQGNYVTQTVYGFLDFTTTIGNTVMVFSPQSAAIPAGPAKEPSSNAVIETKPPPEVDASNQQIQPSRTEAPPDPPSSRVNVIEGKAAATAISSKVEVAPSEPIPSIITKVEVVSAPPVISSKVEIVSSPPSPIILSSVVEVVKSEEDAPAVIIGNNIGEPEYDFLSRQPSEVVEETYKVINLKPSSKFHLKPRASAADAKKPAAKRTDSLHPTGLVTKLGGTVVKEGTTTIHETSVIGTYISGKYAQVLQSTSHIHNNGQQKAKISPSPSLRILKTAAPSLGKGSKQRHLEPTPVGAASEETALPVDAPFNSQVSIKGTRKPAGSSFKARFKNKPKEQEGEDTEDGKKAARNRTPQRNNKHNTSSSPHRPYKSGRRKTTTTSRPVSVHSEEATPAKRYQSRRNKQQQQQQQRTSASASDSGYSRRVYKPKVQTSTVEQSSASTSLYKFKLNRSPGRWQYKTTPKPRVTIRKSNDDDENETLAGTTPSSSSSSSSGQQDPPNEAVTPQSRSDDVDGLEGSESIASIIDDQGSTENKLDPPPFPLETLKVEISTPPDFKDIYYEIATIKSPYTFQVGNVKNTRYITVTSTFEKSLVNTPEATITEPLTENILATSSNYGKDNNFLDSSVATLPPIYLASDMETPPLETLTETFSTTQTMLKTHLLPVVRSGRNETDTSTLVQTYLVTRLVTATKTLPPMEAYHFLPSKSLNEFNSHLDEAGSELHLELEFGDQNEQDEEGHPKRAFPADLDLTKIGSDFDLSDVDRPKLPKKVQPTTAKPEPALRPEQLQQLALLRLLNPGQVVTTSKPVIKVETVYESHVIPVTNGANTVLSTLSKIVGTVTKTDYEFGTSTLAPALPPVPVVNPLFPGAAPHFAVTSSPVVHSAFVTQTNSKILKLTFGAKTAYTTVFSTKVVPTLLTTYMTTSVAVQPTAAFPGYFPPPYPGYPFVG